jgi:hypothetical protein
LLSYDESYVPEVDVEGIIGVKKKNIWLQWKEMEGNHFRKFCFEDTEGAEWGILSWNKGGDVLFAKLQSTFPSPNDKKT